MANYVPGCDVSQFQEANWSTSVYHFVIVRTSFGLSITLDPNHDAHVKRGRNADMLVGHYHFLRPGSIQKQAENFVKNSNAKPGELLVCDWESYPPKPGATPTYPTNAEKDQFIKAVKKLAPQNKVLLYCNVDFWQKIDKTSYCGDGLWIAWYNSTLPPISAKWDIWQYSQSNDLDKNHGQFASIAAMKKWANELVHIPTPSPIPSPTPSVTVATVDGVPIGPYKTSGTHIKWRPLYHNNNVQANSTCYCVTQAIAVAEAKLKKLGVIKNSLDFWQFGYGQAATASADTHAGGGVIDTVQTDDVTWQVLREVGFTASWYRGPGWQYGNFSTEHIHAVLSNCPHVSAGAKAQINSSYQGVKNGKNGLANGASDYAPKAVKDVGYITWQQAFKKFVKDTQTTPNNNTGDNTVTKPFHVGSKAKPQKIKKANTYQTLFFAPSSCSFAYGPGDVTGNINLVVSGIGKDDTLYFRTVAYDYTDNAHSQRHGEGVLNEIHGGLGWQWGPSTPFIHSVNPPAKGWKTRRLRFEWTSNNPNAQIERVDIQGEVK